jgi:protocatechuate 3,4-dioxygenase beta subunit
MSKHKPEKLTRRSFLQQIATVTPFMLVLGGGKALATPMRTLLPTPDCGDDDDVTPRQTEGPYYTPNSPERISLLEPGIIGTKITVTGQVLTTDCKPVVRALVDFWHANDDGEYDNVGYKLRGHQFTDAAGRYTLKTIVPGLYPGRTRHFHVKVQAPNQRILTTQLYFPDEPNNKRDRIYNSKLLMEVKDAISPQRDKVAVFNFVLKIA